MCGVVNLWHVCWRGGNSWIIEVLSEPQFFAITQINTIINIKNVLVPKLRLGMPVGQAPLDNTVQFALTFGNEKNIKNYRI